MQSWREARDGGRYTSIQKVTTYDKKIKQPEVRYIVSFVTLEKQKKAEH